MRRLLGATALAIAVVLASSGCEPTEPAMTITAASSGQPVSCGQMMSISGTVTPATATAKVALQVYASGKWADVKGWGSYETSHTTETTKRTANVSAATGNYSIPYFVDWYQSTKRLRVRSAGSSAFSHSIYVKSEGTDGDC